MTDAQQFEAFLHNYQNMVFSTAMRLLANQSDAEDISQEVFLRAFERFDDLRGSPTVGGWLKTVATNLSLNHLSRYRSRWTFFSDLFRGSEEDEEQPVDFPSPEDTDETLAAADRRELVEQAGDVHGGARARIGVDPFSHRAVPRLPVDDLGSGKANLARQDCGHGCHSPAARHAVGVFVK